MYKEFIVYKVIFFIPHVLLAFNGALLLIPFLLDGNWMDNSNFWSLFFSILLLIVWIFSCFNYDGCASYGYFKEMHLLDTSNINITYIQVLYQNSNTILSNVLDCLCAIQLLHLKERYSNLNYERLIKIAKGRSTYSHYRWCFIEQLSNEDLNQLIKYFFIDSNSAERRKSYLEFLIYERLMNKDFIFSLFCGFDKYFKPTVETRSQSNIWDIHKDNHSDDELKRKSQVDLFISSDDNDNSTIILDDDDNDDNSTSFIDSSNIPYIKI